MISAIHQFQSDNSKTIFGDIRFSPGSSSTEMSYITRHVLYLYLVPRLSFHSVYISKIRGQINPQH